LHKQNNVFNSPVIIILVSVCIQQVICPAFRQGGRWRYSVYRRAARLDRGCKQDNRKQISSAQQINVTSGFLNFSQSTNPLSLEALLLMVFAEQYGWSVVSKTQKRTCGMCTEGWFELVRVGKEEERVPLLLSLAHLVKQGKIIVLLFDHTGAEATPPPVLLLQLHQVSGVRGTRTPIHSSPDHLIMPVLDPWLPFFKSLFPGSPDVDFFLAAL
jgi:hypothetical protein